ncbi:hypothetical protein C9374_003410 [Naegleria lovaniensis]|uniref:Uncharacterized protein n=1 Tax=Naegleria lovaniensis TaxID=51637 RepID=A0AA88GMV3_NAELO|nr:uncharacterized protein C9374_003410 [Naegleria lovaniensis]KAG2385595.1 hypothetical protein C9374_003410 [Naegleria lovaniensis]
MRKLLLDKVREDFSQRPSTSFNITSVPQPPPMMLHQHPPSTFPSIMNSSYPSGQSNQDSLSQPTLVSSVPTHSEDDISNTKKRKSMNEAHSNGSTLANTNNNTSSYAVQTRKRAKSHEVISNTSGVSHSSSDVRVEQHQTVCCIEGCARDVSNRLRFSLRCPTEFKREFIASDWNNVCNYCYFHDLYQWKKLNMPTTNASTGGENKKQQQHGVTARKRSSSSVSSSTKSSSTSSSTPSNSPPMISIQQHAQQQQPTLSHPTTTTHPSLYPNNHSVSDHSNTNNTQLPSMNSTSSSPVYPMKKTIAKKPLKIDTSFTTSTSTQLCPPSHMLLRASQTQMNIQPQPPQQQNMLVDPSPVHREDVNTLIKFLQIASTNSM